MFQIVHAFIILLITKSVPYNYCISTNDSSCVIKLLLQKISFVIVIMYISAIINAIKQDFFIFWRKSGIHESVLVWHFLNCRLWENEGAEVFLGWKLTIWNSQWFIRVQIFPLCTELGRRCWVNGQSVFTQQSFNHIKGKGFPCQIQR